jgi:hypothetical protein
MKIACKPTVETAAAHALKNRPPDSRAPISLTPA